MRGIAVTSMTAEELIADVKRLAGQFGKLADANAMSYPDVLKIIEHYEVVVHQAQEDHKADVAALNGKIGGLTKALNKATK